MPTPDMLDDFYAYNDWADTQEVRYLAADAPGPAPVVFSLDERVHDTYRRVFREDHRMIGEWVDAVRDGRTVEPDLAEGARVQHLLDLAARSASGDGRLLDARTGR